MVGEILNFYVLKWLKMTMMNFGTFKEHLQNQRFQDTPGQMASFQSCQGFQDVYLSEYSIIKMSELPLDSNVLRR